MIHQILVPLDTSMLAELVLPHVRAVAAAFQARVHLLSVVERRDPMSGAVDALEWRLARDECTAYLEEVAASLRDDGLEVTCETAGGAAADQILEVASARGCDLLALTSHGCGGRSEFPLSGTVSKVLSRAPASVLVVKPSATVPAQPPAYRRILAPVDCSARGDWGVHLAAHIAEAHDAELLLVTVVELPHLVGSPQERPEQARLARRLTALNRQVAESHLAALAERLANGRLRLRTRVVDATHAAKALHGIAREEECSLLVLSAHGQSPEAGWPYGAVARSLLEHCDHPVLVFQDVEAIRRPEIVEDAPRDRLRLAK